jgi:lipopolysaccharide transport system ATP-binding protein
MSSKSDLALSVRGLSKSYTIAHQQGEKHSTLAESLLARARRPFARAQRETFWALKDVSFDINKGDVVGIIGRNGAGKSTLLKILSRITEPTTGQIDVYGRIGSLLEVGTGFHPELTGRENIFLNGAILGMARAEIRKQFDAIVDFAGVEQFLDTPVKRYSSGMYVRLAFAVAAHLRSEILIVDEVLAVGDAAFQKKCLGKMKDVSRGGSTVLFVSHNLPTIRNLCSAGILLRQGSITKVGSVHDVVDLYLGEMSTKDQNSVDLASSPRYAGMGERLRLEHLLINNGNAVRHGEPVKFQLHYSASADSSEVAFGIGICTLDGTRVVSIDTDIPGPRFAVRAGERGHVLLTIPQLHLEPDKYCVDVGVRSGDYSGLDYVTTAILLAVSPGPRTPGVISLRESGRGGWRQPSCETRKVVL